MKYAFVAEHRAVFSVRAMCRCFNIHPNGFYAWAKNPLGKRAREDMRQTELIRQAWADSGKAICNANRRFYAGTNASHRPESC